MRTAVKKINAVIQKNCPIRTLAIIRGLNDFLFARRVYIDLTGTIPNYAELVNFVNDESLHKRTHLVNRLLASEGYVSSTYNYFAEMLRLQTGKKDLNFDSSLFASWLKIQSTEQTIQSTCL